MITPDKEPRSIEDSLKELFATHRSNFTNSTISIAKALILLLEKGDNKPSPILKLKASINFSAPIVYKAISVMEAGGLVNVIRAVEDPEEQGVRRNFISVKNGYDLDRFIACVEPLVASKLQSTKGRPVRLAIEDEHIDLSSNDIVNIAKTTVPKSVFDLGSLIKS